MTGEEPSDAQLLCRWRDERDEQAFHLLVERHGPLVWRVARSHCRDPHLSDDAFQQTFLALARHADRIKPGPLAPWLHTTAWRATRDLLRQACKQPFPSGETEHIMDDADQQEDDQEDIVSAIDQALAALPEHLRAVALLHGLQGVPLRRCAEQLGHPSGSIGGLWSQARERLQRHLRRFGGLELTMLAAIWQQALAASDPSPQQIEQTVASVVGHPSAMPAATGSLSWVILLLATITVAGLLWFWWPWAADPSGPTIEAGRQLQADDRRYWQIDPAIAFTVASDPAGTPIITLRKRTAEPRRATAAWHPPARPASFTISYRYWSTRLDAEVPAVDRWPYRRLQYTARDGGYLVSGSDAGESRQGWVSVAQFTADDPLAWSIAGTGEIHLAELRLQP